MLQDKLVGLVEQFGIREVVHQLAIISGRRGDEHRITDDSRAKAWRDFAEDLYVTVENSYNYSGKWLEYSPIDTSKK